jgi:hypothetical protein
MLSQDPALAISAHELVAEAEEALRAGQQQVRAAFRRTGVVSDASEASSMAGGPVRSRQPAPGRASGPIAGLPPPSFLPFRWRSEAARGHRSR